MAWAILIAAGLLEIAWASALKKADGLNSPGWGIAGITPATLSLALLSLALRDVPVGSGYAVWVGIGSIGVTLVGIIAFGDKVTPARLAGLAAIITGIAGLRLLGS